MGNIVVESALPESSKEKPNPIPASIPSPAPIKPIPPKDPKPTTNDLDFLASTSGLGKEEVEDLFAKFSAKNPDGKLDKVEFVRLYTSLRPEKPERLDEISVHIFRAFDRNGDNSITFSEFLVAYALTTKGDLRKKLEYAFDMYDSDRNQTLDYAEVFAVITGMLDLLGADKTKHNAQEIAKNCIKQLDSSNDGKVTKQEFVQGLLDDYSLRVLMEPFA